MNARSSELTATRSARLGRRPTAETRPIWPTKQQRERRLRVDFEVQQQPQRLQRAAIFEQVGLVDDDHRVSVEMGVLSEIELAAGGRFLRRCAAADRPAVRRALRPGRPTGRGSTSAETRVGRTARSGRRAAASSMRASVVLPVPAGPAKQRRAALVLDRVAELDQRPSCASHG